MPKLIGISGLKTSGKDSTYQFIKEFNDTKQAQMRCEKGWRTQRAAFADSLKSAAATAIGFNCEDLIGEMDECKETWKFDIWDVKGPLLDGVAIPITEFSGRQYLQWFGGGMREVFGDNFWIDQVLPYPGFVMGNMAEEIDACYKEESFWRQKYPDADIVVVTDVRYPNEAQRIKELKGKIWEIVRPGLESDGHSSEIPLPRDLVDLTIVNDGTLADLKRKVGEVL